MVTLGVVMMPELSFDEMKILWEEFFNSPTNKYKAEACSVSALFPIKKSIDISYNDIEAFNPELADSILNYTNMSIKSCQVSIKAFLDSDMKNILNIRFIQIPKSTNHVLIRKMGVEYINKLISIEGTVSKMSETRPKIKWANFKCWACPQEQMLWQESIFFQEPNSCLSQEEGGCGRSFMQRKPTFREDYSIFIDSQIIELMEDYEHLKAGENPQKVKTYMEDDLTDRMLPGDKVILNGILKTLQKTYNTKKLTRFDYYLEVVSIEIKEKEEEDLDLSEDEIVKINQLSSDPKLLDKIASSIAPQIKGMTRIKKAIALQMFGGVEKKYVKTKMRGDIHILLVGDPGVAKTQILKYVSLIHPRGRFASGLSSSAAGLCAAVVREEGIGDGQRWTVEAGAMVYADKGICCVDEIEKMRPEDRTALHEALEQQTITVNKAGVSATLVCRTTMLSACNPKSGKFIPNKPFIFQIDLAPPLLSRFDLVYQVVDKPDPIKDSEIADHILFIAKGAQESILNLDSHIIKTEIDLDILKKYIRYSKQNIFPVFDEGAMKLIKRYYLGQRSKTVEYQNDMSINIAPRQLEGLIRLSEASAKMRLSEKIEEQDAELAIETMDFSMGNIYEDNIALYNSSYWSRNTDSIEIVKMKSEVIRILTHNILGLPHDLLFDGVYMRYRSLSPEIFKIILNELESGGVIFEDSNHFYKLISYKEE